MKIDKDLLDSLIDDWKVQRPELDASAMLIVGRILKLGKVLERRAGKSIRDLKIYYTDLDVLATLRRSGAPYELTPTQLMESVLITSGAMTALLDRLEKMALLYRSQDENDGRVKRAGLTKQGIKIIDRAIKIRFEEATDAIKMFNGREKKVLSDLLKKMNLNLKEE